MRYLQSSWKNARVQFLFNYLGHNHVKLGAWCICMCLFHFKTIFCLSLHAWIVKQLPKMDLEVDIRLIVWWWLGQHHLCVQCNVPKGSRLILWLCGMVEQIFWNIEPASWEHRPALLGFEEGNSHIFFTITKMICPWLSRFNYFVDLLAHSYDDNAELNVTTCSLTRHVREKTAI